MVKSCVKQSGKALERCEAKWQGVESCVEQGGYGLNLVWSRVAKGRREVPWDRFF